jgi:RNA 2',3'-cyclic 3'-phosphodiesterase
VRLFVAIVPPPAVLAEVAAALSPLQAARPELRWTGPEDWHLTLAFLGEVAEPVLDDLTLRLGRAAARHPVQRLSVRGGGAFPRPSRASVLWAGMESDGDLAALAASVAAGARRAGAAPPDEGRRYRPHLTLARSRQAANLTDLAGTLEGFQGQTWAATEIRLIRSNLNASPRYEDLGRWPLRSGGKAG